MLLEERRKRGVKRRLGVSDSGTRGRGMLQLQRAIKKGLLGDVPFSKAPKEVRESAGRYLRGEVAISGFNWYLSLNHL